MGAFSTLKKTVQVFGTTIKYGAFTYCTIQFVGDVIRCSGPSMEPTIYNQNIVLTEHISANFGSLERGDIVVSRSPTNPQEFICKRIAAVAGMKVKKGFKNITVPKGHVWLEGDNKANSTDSRTYGPVPLGLIRGRVVFRIWPLDDAKVF